MSLQAEEALKRANKVRLARLDAKRRLCSGDLTVGDALELECCEKATVFEVLCSQHRWGRDRTLRVLGLLRISETRRVKDLTERQRELLVQACSPKRKVA